MTFLTSSFSSAFVILVIFAHCSLSGDYKSSDSIDARSTNNDESTFREDYDRNMFARALIGKWKSRFSYEHKRNILSMELLKDDNIKIQYDNTPDAIIGKYKLSFDVEPSAGNTTYATISIIPNDSAEIKLKKVYFGKHSGIPYNETPLRIDLEPYGVLVKSTK